MKLALCGLILALSGLALADSAPEWQWTATYDGGGLYIDDAVASLTDAAGNLVLAGVSHDGVDGIDMLICKLSAAAGAILWEQRVPAFDTNDMATSGMVWDGSGDLLVAGYVVGCVG